MTYYIQFERQGNLLAIVKVEAETYEEAECKACRALHSYDDISETDGRYACEAVYEGVIDYIMDENGDEIDIDTDEEEEE